MNNYITRKDTVRAMIISSNEEIRLGSTRVTASLVTTVEHGRLSRFFALSSA